MRIKLIALFSFCTIIGCTPYDSNKVNNKLLQGEWLLHDMYYMSIDSTVISEYEPTDSVVLSFEGDRYIEYLSSNQKEIKLRFEVKDYRIMFYQDSSIFDWTNIEMLSSDSLVLSKANRVWKYQKIK